MENKKQDDPIVILDSSIADWQKFKKIRLEALQNEPQAFGATYAGDAAKSDESWKEYLTDSTRAYIFLENAGEYVGMAGAFKKKDATWMIMAVYLREEFRGMGYAEKIIDLLENKLKKLEVVSATLMVSKDQTRAVNFYKKLGYVIVGEEHQIKLGDGKLHDEFIMQKNLF